MQQDQEIPICTDFGGSKAKSCQATPSQAQPIKANPSQVKSNLAETNQSKPFQDTQVKYSHEIKVEQS